MALSPSFPALSPYFPGMDTALHNPAHRIEANPKIHLLWRHATPTALLREVSLAKGAPAVLVRLVSQPVDRELAAQAGLPLVTLPMAFAGLNEHDPVLREAVLQRLREQQDSEAVCS